MEVLTALIADSASDYQGKLCVLGSFDTICARQYPAVHPHCSIALRLLFRTGDEGKHTIQISFIDSDGKAILPEGGPRIEFTMGEPPAQAFFWSQNFIFNIAGLRLPSPGQYSLDVLYDGKIVSRIPLQGVQIQQPAQHAVLAAESEPPAMESAKQSFHHTKHPKNTAQDLVSVAPQC